MTCLLTKNICSYKDTLIENIRSQLKLKGINNNNIVYNPDIALLYEDALREEQYSFLSNTGALIVSSGVKTGRSPKDKRIVSIPGLTDKIWWGEVNIPINEDTFSIHRETAVNFMNIQDKIYVIDGYAGWDPKYRVKIRTIVTRPYHAFFMINMLVKPTSEELLTFGEPDFTILNSGCAYANKRCTDNNSQTIVGLNFESKEMVILGTQYAGEMKKGVLTYMMYLMLTLNQLPLHSSCNVDKHNNVTFFFGLSGTGKTTLSTDPTRMLIGDDEHVWTSEGIFNIEGGCYAKCNGLSPEKESEIYAAIRYGTILENIRFDPFTREVDYNDVTITENTRASYPLEFIESSVIPAVTQNHPNNIILLTCDGFGVLPIVSKLTKEQLIYHFIMGYTSKISGTEVGVKDYEATFSPCYGGPFLIFHPYDYGKLLAEKLETHKVNAWLINVGWVGGSVGGKGKRIDLKYTRAIVHAINNNLLSNDPTQYTLSDIFNLAIPNHVQGVPDDLLFQQKIWKDTSEYNDQLLKLAKLFNQQFEQYKNYCSTTVEKAGPCIPS